MHEFCSVIISLGTGQYENLLLYFRDLYKKSSPILHKMYKELQSEVSSHLKMFETTSITTDIWSSRNRTKYIGFTAHVIDKDFQLMSYCLGIQKVYPSAKAHIIKSLINKCIQRYVSPKSTFYVTTDNGPNIVAACKSFKHIRCANHNLALSLKYVTNTLKICTKKRYKQSK
jgi:hypothetical protein